MKIIDTIKRNDVYIVMAFAILLFNLFIFVGQSPVVTPVGGPGMEELVNTQFSNEMIAKAVKEKPFLEVVFYAFGLVGFVLLFTGIWLLFDYLRRVRKKEITFFPATKVPGVGWGWADVVRMIILIAFLGYVLNFFEAVGLGMAGITNYDENVMMLVNTAVLDVLIVILILFFVKRKFYQPVGSLGLNRKELFGKMLAGIRGYLGLVPFLLLLLFLINWVVELVDYQVPLQPIFDILMKEDGAFFITLSMIFVTVFGPFVEELFFRGFLYPALKNSTGRYIAMFVSAAFFAGLHANLVGFLPIFVLGSFLVLLYDLTGDLTASITVHMFHNLLISSLVILMRVVQ